ncbi:MAG: N-acetylmuramoyl-L-alanine amidase [Erysipelotrichaceae bacterium]|nr:N-acetylmuramoyl-L-alanine amidase [Erysipelotrichaceae bacterium]
MKKAIFLILIVVTLTAYFFYNRHYKCINSLANAIIFIDPGHGGKDNGTHYEDIFEDELNMKLASILYEEIIEDGGICYISRIADYDLSSAYAKNHKIEDLKKRVEYIDSFNTTLFVSLHLNYYSSSVVNGIQVFYQKSNEKSRNLAIILQDFLNKENVKDKKCKMGDFYILNNTSSVGVLIEYGFLSNEYDRKKLLDDSYLKKLSYIIKEGINQYLNNSI